MNNVWSTVQASHPVENMQRLFIQQHPNIDSYQIQAQQQQQQLYSQNSQRQYQDAQTHQPLNSNNNQTIHSQFYRHQQFQQQWLPVPALLSTMRVPSTQVIDSLNLFFRSQHGSQYLNNAQRGVSGLQYSPFEFNSKRHNSRPVKLEALFDSNNYSQKEQSLHQIWSSNSLLYQHPSLSVPNLLHPTSVSSPTSSSSSTSSTSGPHLHEQYLYSQQAHFPVFPNTAQQQQYFVAQRSLRYPTQPISHRPSQTKALDYLEDNHNNSAVESQFPVQIQWAPFSAPATIMASNHGQVQSQNGRSSKNTTNFRSKLLDDDENKYIFSLLERKCQSLSTTVVQLLLTEPPSHMQWKLKCTGVACFVKNNPKRSYFIQIFDIDNGRMIWQQELYDVFDYKVSTPTFHTFEGDKCMAGLNFCDESEARHFADTVNEKIRRRLNFQSQAVKMNSGQGYPGTSFQPTSQGILHNSQSRYTSSNTNAKSRSDKKKPRKLNKEDIGLPIGHTFQHLQHIGFNSQNNKFESIVTDDKSMVKFLNAAGVTQDHMNDENTRNFIHDFITNHGGYEQALSEAELAKNHRHSQTKSSSSASIPPKPAPPIPPSIPPQPSRTALPPVSKPVHTSSIHSGSQPPPIPKAPSLPPAPPVHSSMPPSYGVAPPPPPPPPPASFNSSSVGAPPPPPPPPPPPSGDNIPPPPAMPKSDPGPPRGNLHTSLMEQIRKGPGALNHVNPDTNSNGSNHSGGGDARDELMSQIRKGAFSLKPVQANTTPPPTNEPSGGPLATALARALQERSRALNQTDESDDDDEDDDDEEWED